MGELKKYMVDVYLTNDRNLTAKVYQVSDHIDYDNVTHHPNSVLFFFVRSDKKKAKIEECFLGISFGPMKQIAFKVDPDVFPEPYVYLLGKRQIIDDVPCCVNMEQDVTTPLTTEIPEGGPEFVIVDP